MARRRGTPDAYTFDLVPDDEAGSGPGLGGEGGEDPSPGPSLRERAAARFRASTRRQRAVAAGAALGTVLAVGGGVAIATAVQDHQAAERLRAAPGGAVGIDGPLEEAWALELDGGVLAVLPDGGILTRVGDAAVAVDVSDGSERWRHPLGPDVDCGPQPRPHLAAEWAMPSEVVVCLAGPSDARQVTVLDAGGTVVGERTLDAAYAREGVQVEPASDGMLAVLERPGPLPEPFEMSAERSEEVWARLEEGWIDGEDAVLRLEDAVSGEVVTEVDAPFEPVSLFECGGVSEDGDRVVAEFPPGELVASPALVEHRHCGVDVAVAATGAELAGASAGWSGVGWFGSPGRTPYPDGGFVADDGTGGSRLVDAQGETTASYRGTIVAPVATDGTAAEVVFVDAYDGSIGAFDRDGTELWHADVSSTQVLARAGGVAVVGGYEEVVALELETGEELWRTTGATAGVTEDGADSATMFAITSAVTDGTTMLATALTDGGTGATTRPVSIDLATGAVEPHDVEVEGWAVLVAVDGRPLLQVFDVEASTAGRSLVVGTVRGLGPA